jgi:hypothetical protein
LEPEGLKTLDGALENGLERLRVETERQGLGES